MKGNIRMTWRELNDELRKAKNAKVILKLYKAERKGKRRKRWLTKIYCRYSYLRRKKEMQAVTSAESFV
jgi:hypothetical protein